MKDESAGVIAAKLTPPATVIAAEAAGMTLQDWVHVVTLAYLGLLILHLLWKNYVGPKLAPKRGRRWDDHDEHEDAGV